MDTTTLDNPEEEIWQSPLTLLTALRHIVQVKIAKSHLIHNNKT